MSYTPVVPAVLPATAAYTLFPTLQNSEVVTSALILTAIWAISYVTIKSAVFVIKK